MSRKNKMHIGLIVLLVFLFACSLGTGSTPNAAATLNPLYTAAAQTLEAMALQGTVSQGDLLTSLPEAVVATATLPISLISPTPNTFPPTISLCNAAAFIKDVTVLDGTMLAPGNGFTKTWRLKNVGTCSWSPSYTLVFVNGDAMDAQASINLARSVKPGEIVDLSINLTAPTKSGHYRSYWKLRASSGGLFGIGEQSDTAFWVDITVTGPEHVAFDFYTRACDANWKYNNGSLPCPGTEGDDRGYVLALTSPHMEDGTIETQPGLLTVPKHTANGYIQGKFPAFRILPGDRFFARINCRYNANTCDVIFRLEYRIIGGQIQTFEEWHEVYEGKYYPVDLDLSSLAGENVRFYLTVLANGSKGKDYALWLAPRIVRQGTPAPTLTSTSTATPTHTASTTPSPTITSTPTSTFTLTPSATP